MVITCLYDDIKNLFYTDICDFLALRKQKYPRGLAVTTGASVEGRERPQKVSGAISEGDSGARLASRVLKCEDTRNPGVTDCFYISQFHYFISQLLYEVDNKNI